VAPQGSTAYRRSVSSDHDAEVAAALTMLARMEAELDDAVAGAPEIDNYLLAAPEIRALLLRAVNARNHLDSVLCSTWRSPGL
jgi:hypothetical protein